MTVQLILDEASVAAHQGVRFQLNQVGKHGENPVLIPGEPHQWDSLQISWPATVLYSAADGLFRCWYAGLNAFQTPGRNWLYGYAQSGDGVHWSKPDVDQATFDGKPTNQIRPLWVPLDEQQQPQPPHGVWILSLVFENPLPGAPPQQRFGAYWIERITVDGRETMRKVLAWSPDGISWQRDSVAHEIQPYSRWNFHDICQLLYDPDDPDPAFRVKAYSQFFAPRSYDGRERVRHIALLQGRAFAPVQPLQEPIVLSPQQGIDEEIHFATVKKISGQYLMLFESDNFSKNPIRGDLRLAVSPDGRRFRRIFPDTPLVARGPKGTWDENLLATTTSAIQEVGDELFIFYVGCPNLYNSWPAQYAHPPERRGSMFSPTYLGLATLPRDRFACAVGPGHVMLTDVHIGGDGLWLNADGDTASVQALDSAGKTSASGQLGGQRRQSVYRKVAWAGTPPQGPCPLRITLAAGEKLYSVSY